MKKSLGHKTFVEIIASNAKLLSMARHGSKNIKAHYDVHKELKANKENLVKRFCALRSRSS